MRLTSQNWSLRSLVEGPRRLGPDSTNVPGRSWKNTALPRPLFLPVGSACKWSRTLLLKQIPIPADRPQSGLRHPHALGIQLALVSMRDDLAPGRARPDKRPSRRWDARAGQAGRYCGGCRRFLGSSRRPIRFGPPAAERRAPRPRNYSGTVQRLGGIGSPWTGAESMVCARESCSLGGSSWRSMLEQAT